MKKYLSILLMSFSFASAYGSSVQDFENLPDEASDHEDDSRTEKIIKKINHYIRILHAFGDAFDSMIESFNEECFNGEYYFDRENDTSGEFFGRIDKVREGIAQVIEKAEDAIARLERFGDKGQGNDFEISSVIDVVIHSINFAFDWCNENRGKLGEKRYNKIGEVLSRAKRISLLLKTAIILKSLMCPFSCCNIL